VVDVDLSSVPVAALVAVGVLIVVQVTLDVIAFIDLYRRPVEQVVGGNKWIWVAVILLVNTIGAIIYLVAGRKPGSDDSIRATQSSIRAEDVADALYGEREDPEPR
jgi:Phospholipase_D-nuclease N-terminal